MVVATRLSRDVGRLRYCCVPAELTLATWPYRFDEGTVTVVRVLGLDPRAPDGLRNATAGIGRVLRAAYETAAGDSVEVHLTGGLKFTLLHIMTMTEVLGALPGADVSAWYLFDDDPGHPQAVRIDMRRLSEEYVAVLRDELRAVRDRSATGGRAFEGYGWVEEHGRRTLNAFGTGFLTVLGEPAATFGDDGVRS